MTSEDDRMKRMYWEAIHNYILRGESDSDNIKFYSFEEFKQKNKHLLNPPSFSVLAARLVEQLVGWKPTTLVWLEGRYRPMPKAETIRLKAGITNMKNRYHEGRKAAENFLATNPTGAAVARYWNAACIDEEFDTENYAKGVKDVFRDRGLHK